MTSKDTNGRPYAKLSDLSPGDKLEADGGFYCLDEGEIVTVERLETNGRLYVPCHGPEGPTKHFLDGQLEYDEELDCDALIGLYPVA